MAKGNEQGKAQAAEAVEEKAAPKEQEAPKEQKAPNEQEAPKEPNPEDRIMITLFKDNERYKDPLPVGVNGKMFLIQRGVPVEVPRYVAEVINNSLSQDNAAQLLMSRLAEEYEEATLAQK